MRLQITTSVNAKCFYVVKSVYYNGKRSNRVIEKLGNLEEVTKKANGEDPIEWAKQYVEKLTRVPQMCQSIPEEPVFPALS